MAASAWPRGSSRAWQRSASGCRATNLGSMAKRVLVIGLDCAAPQFVFDRWLPELPTIRSLTERGSFGVLRSCDPPITVPAWSVMTSSRSPGSLGFYGFRNRKDHSYDQLEFADSRAVRVPRVWDILSAKERDVIVLGVPQTYPPSRVKGEMVSCFLTPDTRTSRYTYPPELKDEIEQLVGHYMVDVENFRTDDKDRLLDQIEEMTEKRFRLAEHLLETRPWDMFFMVEMGTDRIHHGFWRFTDSEHRLFEPGNPYEHAMLDYYKRLDSKIARPAAVRGRRDGGAGRLGSRREADGRRHLHQRVAAARGLSRPARGADRADAAHARPHRLVAHRRVGRGRLLLPPVPQRRGPRAGGRRLPGRLRTRAGRAEGEARGARRRPGTADRHGRAPARGPVRGGARDRARPSRLLRRPLLAERRPGRDRHGARVRERHRARRREPRARRAVRARGATACRRAPGRSARCTTSRRRSSSSSASPCRRRWRGGACSALRSRRRGRRSSRQQLATNPSRTRELSPVRLESGWWRGVAPGATAATE